MENKNFLERLIRIVKNKAIVKYADGKLRKNYGKFRKITPFFPAEFTCFVL